MIRLLIWQGVINMIHGEIHHLEDYKKQIPSFIFECLQEVKKFPFHEKEDGKYEILGCTMSVESPMTEYKEDRKTEGHKKFIDIQFEIHGEERMGVIPKWEAVEEIEAHEDRDLYFYNIRENKESFLYMEDGWFAVFFPEDLHRPLCAIQNPTKIRKAVVKVPVEKIK